MAGFELDPDDIEECDICGSEEYYANVSYVDGKNRCGDCYEKLLNENEVRNDDWIDVLQYLSLFVCLVTSILVLLLIIYHFL